MTIGGFLFVYLSASMKTINRLHRRSIRLKEYDYSHSGEYFVTNCTHDHECILSEIINGEMRLNAIGKIAEEGWLRTANIRPGIELDVFENKMPSKTGQHFQASGGLITYTVSL